MSCETASYIYNFYLVFDSNSPITLGEYWEICISVSGSTAQI